MILQQLCSVEDGAGRWATSLLCFVHKNCFGEPNEMNNTKQAYYDRRDGDSDCEVNG